MSKIFESATFYISKLKWHIQPVRRGTKIPMLQDWTNLSFPTENDVRDWLEREDINIGVLTGRKSGLIVVDVDVKNNGITTLQELEAKYGKMPLTLTVTTGTGGKHYYFKYPDMPEGQTIQNKVGIFKGIDIRADGGQVVAPPSINEQGKPYVWDNKEMFKSSEPLATIPQWLLDVILGNDKTVNSISNIDGDDSIIPAGQRNDRVFRKACELRARGVKQNDILSMLKGFNSEKCKPPLNYYELKNIVNSAYKYDVPEDDIQSFNLTPLNKLLEEPEEPISYLVGNMLPVKGLSVLAGKPKSGKTTLVRNLIYCIAEGRPFLDREVKQGKVIYLALEEKRSEVKRHFELMQVCNNLENIHIHVASAPQNALQELENVIKDLSPLLVIIDPLFHFINVRDGNDYALVTKAFRPLVKLAREANAHILLVHHSGKGERSGAESILGSTAIFGNVDTAMILRKTENYRTILTDQRYGINLEESVLNFNPQTKFMTLTGTREDADIQKIEQSILEYINAQTEPVTEKEIKESVEGTNKYKVKALRYLLDKQQVNRTGEGKKNCPFLYSGISSTLVRNIDSVPAYQNIESPQKNCNEGLFNNE